MSEQTKGVLLLIIFVLTCLYPICRSLNRAWLLRNIPGPWYTLVSDWALLWNEYNHRRTRWIHSLHLRYGPIVRISNSEVHYNSLEAIKKIYGVRSEVSKDPYYAEFARNGVENMFSTIDDMKHAEKKRGVANHYTRSTLLTTSTVSILWTRVQEFTSLLDSREGVELYTVLSYLTLDVISSIVFGDDFRADTLTDNKLNQARIASDMIGSHSWRRFFRKAGYSSLSAVMTRMNTLSKHYAEFNCWGLSKKGTDSHAHGSDGINGYITDGFGQVTIAMNEKSKVDELQDTTALIHKLMNRGCDDGYIYSETRDHIIAGSDTTTTVLYYLFHTLAKRSDLYEQLRRAVEEIGRDGDERFDVTSLEACEYLDAVITESLRLYAAIPMTLPRILTAPLLVHGHTVPKTTRVGAQCYSMHRDPAIFTNPEVFDPERWSAPTKMMKDQMWAFSSGSRSCIGKSLALIEMKMVVAEVVSRFRINVHEGESAESLEMWEDTTGFSMAPKSKTLKLSFTSTN